MKRIGFLLFLVLGIAAFVPTQAARAAITAIGSLTTVSNTTVSSASLQTNSTPVATGTFVISNGGLASTNALSGAREFSIDGVNWSTIGAVYTPGSTNATSSDNYGPATITVPIYMRLKVTTTNSVPVGAVYTPP